MIARHNFTHCWNLARLLSNYDQQYAYSLENLISKEQDNRNYIPTPYSHCPFSYLTHLLSSPPIIWQTQFLPLWELSLVILNSSNTANLRGCFWDYKNFNGIQAVGWDDIIEGMRGKWYHYLVIRPNQSSERVGGLVHHAQLWHSFPLRPPLTVTLKQFSPT